MDVELKAFLLRAEDLLARIEPLLPSRPPSIDWERTLGPHVGSATHAAATWRHCRSVWTCSWKT